MLVRTDGRKKKENGGGGFWRGRNNKSSLVPEMEDGEKIPGSPQDNRWLGSGVLAPLFLGRGDLELAGVLPKFLDSTETSPDTGMLTETNQKLVCIFRTRVLFIFPPRC